MSKRNDNVHHFVPVSRFKVKKRPQLHDAYHDLFKNRTGWEAIELLREWGGRGGVILPVFLAKRAPRFRSSFQLLFGDERKVSALVRIVQREWIPPGVRMIFDYAEMRRALRDRKDLIGLLPSEDDPE